MEKFNELINKIFEEQSLIKMIFSGLRKKTTPYQRITIRPLLLQGQLCYQIEYHYQKKVTQENVSMEQCLNLCENFLTEQFKQVNLFCVEGDYQILAAKPDKPKIIRKPATKTLSSLDHNQKKQYILPDDEPCDFLIRLGVMDQSGQVIQKHYAKFRQINRFLEIVSDVLEFLPSTTEPLRIVDFGCGKAYLTFALYHYLKLKLGKNVEIIGLDLKTDVIDFCNHVAKDLNYDGLQFLEGDIAEYSEQGKADMVVTLHACDTATDYALMKAVGWSASVILSVPCCQHELFSQISNDLHNPILKHGILNERFCSILTDGLRGLKLEEQGYDVSMIEFTSLEHTSKNIMIRAVKTGKKRTAAGEEYRQLKEYWHVNPTIDQL
ncbi:MAG TPA: SAM-dependent methyltransferase [Anaerovoracaceae bacterium]|nr:SAM-dependent methyltransferase [Anaerovoracaceae bacterium]